MHQRNPAVRGRCMYMQILRVQIKRLNSSTHSSITLQQMCTLLSFQPTSSQLSRVLAWTRFNQTRNEFKCAGRPKSTGSDVIDHPARLGGEDVVQPEGEGPLEVLDPVQSRQSDLAGARGHVKGQLRLGLHPQQGDAATCRTDHGLEIWRRDKPGNERQIKNKNVFFGFWTQVKFLTNWNRFTHRARCPLATRRK